jgi:hypothetical protein
MRACQLRNETYEPKKLEAVYQNIVARSKTDSPQYYEIRVDDFPVIEKTSDPERFMSYADFVDANTKYISIFLYYSNRNASDKLFFHLQPNQYTQGKGLAGLPSGGNPIESESDLKEKWRKELHYEQVLAENAELKEEIEELEKTIELIEEEKDKIKSMRDIGLTGVASYLLEGALGSKKIKKLFPVLNGLSDMGQATEQEPSETDSTFKSKAEPSNETEEEESTEEAVVLSDEDKRLLGVMQDIKQRVGNIELANVIHLLDMVTANPQSIQFAIKQVTNYLKQKPTAKDPEPTGNNDQQETNF